MSAVPDTGAIDQRFPRFFRINGYAVNSYKLFLCIGIYVGTLATAALASLSGLSPLRVGLAAMFCALAGLIDDFSWSHCGKGRISCSAGCASIRL
jgi:phosphatidylglycerol---prolipoprotein diacylglyceryl transferase